MMHDLGDFVCATDGEDDVAQAIRAFLLNKGVPLHDRTRAFSDYPRYGVVDVRRDEVGIGPGCYHRDLDWWSAKGWDEEQWLVMWASSCPTLVRAYSDVLPDNYHPPMSEPIGTPVTVRPRSVMLVDERHHLHAMPQVTADRVFVRAHFSGPVDFSHAVGDS